MAKPIVTNECINILIRIPIYISMYDVEIYYKNLYMFFFLHF